MRSQSLSPVPHPVADRGFAPAISSRTLQRALNASVFLTIFLAAIVYEPGQGYFFERMVFPKTRLAAFGAFVSVTLLLLLVRQSPPLVPARALRRWALLGLAAMGTLMLAIVSSPDPWLRALLWTRFYWCTFALFCVMLLNREAWRPARVALLASGGVVAAQLVLEQFGWRFPGIGDGAVAGFWYLPPSASFVHRNTAAHSLLAPFLLAVGATLTESRRGRMMLRFALVALLASGLAATRCRTVGLACFLAGAMIVVGHRGVRQAARARAIALALAVAIGITAQAFAPMAREYDPLLTKIVSTRVHEPDMTSRYLVWDFATDQIAHHPLLGMGAGEFSEVWNPLHPDNPVAGRNAHNAWLHVAAELGLANALLLLLLVVRIGWAGRSVLRANDPEQAPPVAILIAYFLANMNDFDVCCPTVSLHIGAVAGHVAGMASEQVPS